MWMKVIFLLYLPGATAYHLILDEALGLWEPDFSLTLFQRWRRHQIGGS